MVNGKFIVIEGIDGAGTTTQSDILVKKLSQASKYNDVLKTHEPWQNQEIRRRLKEEKDAYSGAEEMARLYITDRHDHLESLIIPVMNAGGFVISDRYHLSTYAYQQTQGVELKRLIKMHEDRKIINPDITFYLDVDYKTALKRMKKRGDLIEKFEGNREFTEKLIENYLLLYKVSKTNETLFGKIIFIDGKKNIGKISDLIQWNLKQELII